MTDLEITKACAEAMGLATIEEYHWPIVQDDMQCWMRVYDPLHDDAQAMALVKKLHLEIHAYDGWCVRKSDGQGGGSQWHCEDNLNRAICECVAKMRRGKR